VNRGSHWGLMSLGFVMTAGVYQKAPLGLLVHWQ